MAQPISGKMREPELSFQDAVLNLTLRLDIINIIIILRLHKLPFIIIIKIDPQNLQPYCSLHLNKTFLSQLPLPPN
jgi:hypothetical protein